jgi:peptide deformylase
MILPIVAYGHPVLKKVAAEIGPDYPDLAAFVQDMWETMYTSDGVGLAAPQVNRSIRLFVIDTSAFAESYPEATGFKQVFINAELYDESGDEWSFNEGCLSFPGLREDVFRKPAIRIRYVDDMFRPHDDHFTGIMARVIQHEYDHIQGITMVDRISPLRKILLRRRLQDISTGNVEVHYKMIFPIQKKTRKP